ncbi:hypothetical protein SFRURICE_015499 [Spodoptera frugiperda]|nr:hypothetical protein SFRURICE_015499 [Spodoptera frugiperda]
MSIVRIQATEPMETMESPDNISESVDWYPNLICFNRSCITVLVAVVAVVALGLHQSASKTGWLDRLVLYHKERFINELRKVKSYAGASRSTSAPIEPTPFNATLLPKPAGFVDSGGWDYESVVRLMIMLKSSEAAKPTLKSLRRMLQPTRRLMMSMKDSMQKFPGLKAESNDIYYEIEYTSQEEESVPAPEELPEDQVVVVVSNPVEARLPSTRISVQLLSSSLTEWLQLRLPGKGSRASEGLLGFFRFLEHFSVVTRSLELCPAYGNRLTTYSWNLQHKLEILTARARAAREMPTTKPPVIQSITLHPTLFKTQLPVAYPYLRLARLFRVTISGHRKCGPADGEQRPWKPMKSTTGAPSQGGGDAGNGTTGAGAEGGDSTPAGDGGTPGEGGATGETTPAGGGGDAADPTTPEPE